jgi:hypothetical protein
MCNFPFFSFNSVQGKGPEKSESRGLEYFKGLDSGIAADIEVFQSETPRVEVSLQENLVTLLETEVRDEVLYIHFKESVNTDKPVRIKVYAPAIEQLFVSGAGKVDVRSPFKGVTLKVDISGVTDIEFPQADYQTVACDVSGSGMIKIGGKANDLRATVSGVGAIEAEGLDVQQCEATVSGSGDISCEVTENLKATVSGVGSIRYKGDCKVDSHVSGAGSVEKM